MLAWTAARGVYYWEVMGALDLYSQAAGQWLGAAILLAGHRQDMATSARAIRAITSVAISPSGREKIAGIKRGSNGYLIDK